MSVRNGSAKLGIAVPRQSNEVLVGGYIIKADIIDGSVIQECFDIILQLVPDPFCQSCDQGNDIMRDDWIMPGNLIPGALQSLGRDDRVEKLPAYAVIGILSQDMALTIDDALPDGGFQRGQDAGGEPVNVEVTMGEGMAGKKVRHSAGRPGDDRYLAAHCFENWHAEAFMFRHAEEGVAGEVEMLERFGRY